MIAVLNTGVANAGSVIYSLERSGFAATLTDDPDTLKKSSTVILPGVGTAKAFLDRMKSKELDECIKSLTQPVLGICLGMQVLYQSSEEGFVSCLNIFPGTIKRLHSSIAEPVPHMGWNQISRTQESRLLQDVPDSSYFYFVHSFRVPVQTETVATTTYGETFSAVIESSNWFGTQFHPERSGSNGEKVIKNFLAL